MPSPAAILNIVITANASAAQAQLAKTQAQMKAVAATADKSALATAGAWQKTGTRMNAIGKTLTRNVTLPALAVGAASVKMAMDFEHSMSLIQTQAGASAGEVKYLTKQVMDFAASGKSTHGPKELADALYHIESVGYRSAKAIKILHAAEALATTGAANMEETTNALVSAMRTGIKGTQNLTQTVGSLNAIVGAGNMRMDDLNAAMGTGFLSNARQMGLSLNQAGAALAALTRQGQPATAGATRLSMAFRMVMAPTDKAEKALKSIGLTAGRLGTMMQAGKFPQAMHLLVQRLDKLGDSPEALQKKAAIIREMFGARSSTGINTILQGLHQYDQTLTQVNQKSADFNKLHAAAMQTPANRLRAIWAQLQATLIKLGETLTPLVLDLARAFQKVASAVGSLPSWLVEGVFMGAIVVGPMARLVGWVIKLAAAWKAVRAASAGAAGASALAGAAGAGGAAAGGGGLLARLGLGAGAGGLARVAPLLGPAGLAVGSAAGLAALLSATGAIDKGPRETGGLGTALSGLGAGAGYRQAGQLQTVYDALANDVAKIKSGEILVTAERAKQISQAVTILQSQGKITAQQAEQYRQLTGAAQKAGVIGQLLAKIGAAGVGPLQQYGKQAVSIIDKIVTHAENSKLVERFFPPTMQQRVAGALEGIYGVYKSKLNKITGITQKDMLFVAMHMQQGPERGRQAVVVIYDKMVSNVRKAMKDQQISVKKGTALINQYLNEELKLLGFTIAPAGTKPKGVAGPIKQQRGGYLPGPSKGDRIPILAEGGEFMVNAKATKRFLPLLERINQAVPRFAGGGQIPSFTAGAPGVLDDIAAGALNKEARAARRYLARMTAAAGPRGGGASFGPKGVGSYMGITMANWVIQALLYAAKHGSGNPQPTSGYRPWDKDSEHSGTQYPHGAVDFGGYTTGGAAKMRVVNATRGFKFPLLAPIGFSDAGHASGTGHQRGGLVSGNWNKNQLTTLAAYVGMKNPALMAAIAMAESGGNPGATGGAGERGLWQILGSTAKAFGLNWGSLYDPIKNARGAGKILRGQGLKAWSTWRSGAYKRFMGGQVKPGLMAALRGGKAGKGAKGAKGGRGTPVEQIQMAIDLAALTEGTADDIAATQRLVAYWQSTLNALKKQRHPKAKYADISNAATSLAQAQDALESLTGGSDEVAAYNQMVQTTNDLIQQGNLLALQGYQVGSAQNPLLGISTPTYPTQTPLQSMVTSLPSSAAPASPASDYEQPGLFARHSRKHHQPHIHNHFYIDGKEIKGVTKVEMRKAARKGRRKLPSARR